MSASCFVELTRVGGRFSSPDRLLLHHQIGLIVVRAHTSSTPIRASHYISVTRCRPSSPKFLFISRHFCLTFFLSLGLHRHWSTHHVKRDSRVVSLLSLSFSNLFLLPNTTDGAHHLPTGPATSRSSVTNLSRMRCAWNNRNDRQFGASSFVRTVLHDHSVRL